MRRADWIGPSVVAASALAMLTWSWGTWPDPLVDYGMDLYIPWQLAGGKVLYRDIAYYNGPLSSYLNAGIFRIFGPSLHVLEAANLLILAGVMILIYRLTLRASGRGAAVMGGLTFVLIFAFGQQLELGNYNWVTPYVHELTQGIALGLMSMACLDRFGRGGRRRWIVAAGASAGLALLTKAEPGAAAVMAGTAQLLAIIWFKRAELGKTLACFFIPLMAIPLAAVGILWMIMPLSLAMRGAAGSWMWVFDRQIADLPFYRAVTGLDHVPENLAMMGRWTVIYAAFLAGAIGLAMLIRRRGWLVGGLTFVLTAAVLGWQFTGIDWASMLTPLPVCLAVIGLIALAAVLRRAGDGPVVALRLGLVVFSAILLGKIALRAHASHYGFALAMPGTLVLVAAIGQNLPAWIERRGGSGSVLRGAAAAAWLGLVAMSLYTDSHFFQTKRWEIAADTADSFRGSTRALEVRRMCVMIEQAVAPGGTLAVFPQGLMLNYLTRREQATAFVNFMPPEVMAAGEDRIIDALTRHPPDAIVVDGSMVRGGQFDLDGVYEFGGKTLAWIGRNYERVGAAELGYPYSTKLHLVLLKRRGIGT